MSPPFVLAYRPGRADVAALLAPARRFDVAFDLRWLLAACVAAGVGLGLFEDATGRQAPNAFVAAAAIFAAFLAGGALLRLAQRRRAVARWPLPQTVEARVDATGVDLREDGRARFVAWETVLAVAGDAERVMLRLDPVADSVVAPRAAFADGAEMEVFRGYAQARVEEICDDLAEPAPDGPLTVDVEITAQDARRVAQAGVRRMSYAQAMASAALIGALGLGGLAFLIARGFDLSTAWSPWLAGAALGAALGAAALGFGFDRAEARRWRDWTPQRMRLTIDAREVARSADGVEARIDWRAIARIERRDDDLLLWTRGDEAIVAPRRCFADDAAFARFARAARLWRRAALETPSDQEPDAKDDPR